MKKTYLIILGVLMIIFLWAISPFGIFDVFSKQKINLDEAVTQEINDEMEEKKIIRPIQQTTLIIYKKEQSTAIWITDKNGQKHLIFSDTIVLNNNQNGTRLYDEEPIIPEGVYKIETVNSEDLSFTINFPNDFDREKQQADKRPELTSIIEFYSNKNKPQFTKNLMTEFLFLTKEATVENTQIIIVPNNFQKDNFIPNCLTCPFWIEELYGSLSVYLNDFSQKEQ